MHESMLWTNASGFLVALLLGLVSGHLFGGLRFCIKHPQVVCALDTLRSGHVHLQRLSQLVATLAFLTGSLCNFNLLAKLCRGRQFCLLHTHAVQSTCADNRNNYPQDIFDPVFHLPEPSQFAQFNAVEWYAHLHGSCPCAGDISHSSFDAISLHLLLHLRCSQRNPHGIRRITWRYWSVRRLKCLGSSGLRIVQLC